jgi:CDP-glycerol glycerophosphotransferase
MSDRPRFAALARRVVNRLPSEVQAGLRQVTHRLPGFSEQSGAASPLLSVVVVATNAESYLSECLHSLRSQTLKRIEVLVVDNGSTDRTAVVAQELAADDPRFKVIRRPRLGVTPSRNAGARLADGRFLAFVDATDTVPRTAYATLINSLRQTGSDFAAGSVRSVSRGRRRRPSWTTMSHDLDRVAQTLSEFPLALLDTTLTNKVFRKHFWDTVVGGFPTAADASDAIVSATLRARQFDFLQAVSCVQRERLAAGQLLPDPLTTSELETRIEGLWATWEQVRAADDPRIAGVWFGGVIDGELGDLAADAHRADDSYRSKLQQAAQRCLALADDAALRQVRVDRKLRLWLVANQRWTDLEQLIHQVLLYGAIPRTVVQDGRVYAVATELPGGADAPLSYLELGESQTALSGCIERVTWRDQQLQVHGWAFVRGLDLGSETPELTAVLIEPVTGYSYPCEVTTQLHTPAANEWAGFRYQDVAPGGYVVGIDTQHIDCMAGRWQLRLTVRAHGVERTGPIQAVASGGAGHLMWGRNLRDAEDTFRIVPKLDPQLGFVLHVRPERVQATALSTDGVGTASGALRLVDTGLGELVSVAAVSAFGRVEGNLDAAGVDGAQRFRVELPVGVGTPLGWEFRAVDVHGREHRISWPIEGDQGEPIGGGSGDACWQRSITGYCNLMSDWIVAEAENVTVAEDEVSIEVRLSGLQLSDCEDARLSSRVADVAVRRVEPVGGVETVARSVRLIFPLSAARWGGTQLPLPTEGYRIVLASGVSVRCSAQFAGRVPQEGSTVHHHYLLTRNTRGELVIGLAAPLAEDERSRVAQQRLSRSYQQSSFAPTDTVLFQSYRGEFATDSQLAIHAQLRARRPDLELLWGVMDRSVAIPEGGRALLIESREWYTALGSSRYLCPNIEFERYFRKRPYQRYLQTFHGYPFKSMGISLWRAQGRPESVIDKECTRRSGAWDAIVAPESFCVDLYRQEYRFAGEALVTGYPRNDALVTADTASVRARVLAQLGIDPDQIVVLYAPTWRDTVATSAWTAKLFDGLDLHALAERLGDRYAVLVRGHSYNLREGFAPLTGKVWDVSDYPEINDLLLAADVAVLDYSSIRFDWLITGKPVVFFVPDLEDYLSSRKVLFDYPPTAPGPLLGHTTEVAEALLDLDSVISEYAAARELFNKEFNRLHDGQATERVIDAFF